MSTASRSVDQDTAYRLPWRALAVGGLAAATVCAVLMVWVDEPLATAMYARRDTPLVAAFHIVTLLANSTIWYALAISGMAAAWWRARQNPAAHGGAWLRQRLRAGLFLIVSMVASGLLINGLKLLLGRDRPLAFVRSGSDVFHGLGQPLAASGFPSGHSQSIWAAMIAISWIYPPTQPVCVLIAVMVSASRIIIDMHFASDVVAGMYLALITAAVCRALFERNGPPIRLSASR
jgi:membrane-associated phospholipid phosphatase